VEGTQGPGPPRASRPAALTRRRWLAATLAWLFVAPCAGLSIRYATLPHPPHFDLRPQLLAISDSGGGRVSLKDITPFAWDRLYTFPAYMRHGTVRKTLGVHWPPDLIPFKPGSGPFFGCLGEGENWMVFRSGDTLVAWADLSWKRIYVGECPPSVITPDEAVFRVKKGWLGCPEISWLAPGGKR